MISRMITTRMRDSLTLGYDGEYHDWMSRNGCPHKCFTASDFAKLSKKRIAILRRVVK